MSENKKVYDLEERIELISEATELKNILGAIYKNTINNKPNPLEFRI